MESVKQRDFILDPSLRLYLPLWKRDGTSIIPDDAYGRLATVTGALWRLSGRYFDGTDDDITPGIPIITGTTFTVSIWMQIQETIEALRHAWSQTIGVMFWGWNAPFLCTQGSWTYRIDSYANSDLNPHLVTLTRDAGNVVRVYVDDAQSDLRLVTAGPAYGGVVTSYTDTADISADTFYLGQNGAAARYHKGIIGEAWVYNRVLILAEIQRIFQKTKWRYK